MQKLLFFILSSALLLTSTAQSQSTSIKKLDREISKLEKLKSKQEIKINKLTADHKNYFDKSNNLKQEGEMLIAKGKQGQQDSLSRYSTLVSNMGQAKTSEELKDEIKLLKQLESDWSDFDKNIKSGEKALEKSLKMSNKAIEGNEELAEWKEKFAKNQSKLDRLLEQKRLLLQGR